MEIKLTCDDVDVMAHHSSMSWGDVTVSFSDELKKLIAPLYGDSSDIKKTETIHSTDDGRMTLEEAKGIIKKREGKH